MISIIWQFTSDIYLKSKSYMEDSKFSSRSRYFSYEVSCLIDTSKVPSSVLLFYLKLINELVYQIRTPASILHEDHKIYQDDI